MKRNYLILISIAVVCILLLKVGCQGPAEVAASEPEAVVKAAEPVSKEKTKLTARDRSRRVLSERRKRTSGKRREPAIKEEKAREAQVQAAKGGAKIKFEKVVHDFGEVGPGTTNVCSFKFSNTGDAPLKITKVDKTCGCTPFTLAKKEYAPGESGSLRVSYHSSTHTRPATKFLYVNTNARKRPRVTLTIKARVATKVAFKPKELKLTFKAENVSCPDITLTSIDNKPFAIKSFKSTGNSITADIDSSVKSTEFVLKPKVNMVSLQKKLNGRIDITLTHPQCRKVTIRFQTLAKFKTIPSSLVVLQAEPLKPAKKVVWLLNNYQEDFEVESVSSKNNFIKLLSQEKVGNRYKFSLQITPPADEEKRIFRDVFRINIKGGEKVEVNCSGFYRRKVKGLLGR